MGHAVGLASLVILLGGRLGSQPSLGPTMVTLSDSQIASILNALRPLQASERTQFQAALLEALLYHRDEIGDGTIGRLVRDLQKKYFQPPPDEQPSGGRPRGWRLSTDRASPAKPSISAKEQPPADRPDRGCRNNASNSPSHRSSVTKFAPSFLDLTSATERRGVLAVHIDIEIVAGITKATRATDSGYRSA